VVRERLSRSSEDSRVRGWCEKDDAVELSSGGLDVREAGPALGVLAREVEESIKRTAGGR